MDDIERTDAPVDRPSVGGFVISTAAKDNICVRVNRDAVLKCDLSGDIASVRDGDRVGIDVRIFVVVRGVFGGGVGRRLGGVGQRWAACEKLGEPLREHFHSLKL